MSCIALERTNVCLGYVRVCGTVEPVCLQVSRKCFCCCCCLCHFLICIATVLVSCSILELKNGVNKTTANDCRQESSWVVGCLTDRLYACRVVGPGEVVFTAARSWDFVVCCSFAGFVLGMHSTRCIATRLQQQVVWGKFEGCVFLCEMLFRV